MEGLLLTSLDVLSSRALQIHAHIAALDDHVGNPINLPLGDGHCLYRLLPYKNGDDLGMV